MKKPRWIAATFALAALLGACGPAGLAPPTSANTLQIVVSGLPEGIDANILVTGPNAFTADVTETVTLVGLEAGEYEVLASHTQDLTGTVYAGETPVTTVTVTAAAGTRVEVDYEADPIILNEDTRFLSDATVATISGFTAAAAPTTAQSEGTLPPLQSAAHGTLVFSSDSPELQGLETGDILALGVSEHLPYGALGRIGSISRAAGQVTVTLDPATLNEAIDDGSAHAKQDFNDIADIDYLEGAVPGSLRTWETETDDLELCVALAKSANDGDGGSLTVGGELCFAMDFDFSVTFGGFLQDPEIQLITEFTPSFTLSAELRLALADYDSKFIPIAVFTHFPITVPAGPVPLIFVPRTLIGVRVEAGIATAVAMSMSGSATITAGIIINEEYPTGKPIRGITRDFSSEPPNLRIEATAKVAAGAQTDFLLYGVTGGLARALAYLRLAATATEEELNWGLYSGFDVAAGFKFQLLSLKAEATVAIPIPEATIIEGTYAPEDLPVTVTISPTTATLAPSASRSFTATVTGASNPSVTWDATCGSFATSANPVSYTAPDTTGTCYVTATSVEDPSASATATVMVTVPAVGDGLIAHYTFDVAPGLDSSGTGNDATAYGDPELVPGVSGTAILLDGVDDYLRRGALLDGSLLSAYTHMAWFRIDAYPPNADGAIIFSDETSDGMLGISLTQDGKPRPVHHTGVEYIDWTPGPSVALGGWHHYAVTWSGSELVYYLDGNEIGTAAVSGIKTAPAGVAIGALAYWLDTGINGGGLFAGAIDEFRMYSRALTTTEVAAAFGEVEDRDSYVLSSTADGLGDMSADDDMDVYLNDSFLREDPSALAGPRFGPLTFTATSGDTVRVVVTNNYQNTCAWTDVWLIAPGGEATLILEGEPYLATCSIGVVADASYTIP